MWGAGRRWQLFRVFMRTEPFRSSTTEASLGSERVSSTGALPAAKAEEMAAAGGGTITMEEFNKVVVPGWSLLAAVKAGAV